MGIDSVRLRNFQSHRFTKLDFTPGINVITGSSDVGKSSIMRAIKWVVTNRPTGTAFASNFTPNPTTSVSLTIDGTTVTRKRSKSVNMYKLGDIEFKVVKTDVPKEVSEFINLSEEVNFQGQHDKYFLLQDTAGEVAKKINKEADLDIIDFSLKNVNTNITQTDNAITKAKADIKIAETNLEAYDHLDDIEVLCNTLDEQLTSLSECESTIEDIEALVRNIEDTQKAMLKLDVWHTAEKEVNELYVECEEFQILYTKEQSLIDLVDSITKSEGKIAQFDQVLGFENDVLALIKVIEEYETQQTMCKDLLKLLSAVNNTQDKLQDTEQRIEDMTNKMVALVKKTGVCPLCGSDSKDIEDHILEWING